MKVTRPIIIAAIAGMALTGCKKNKEEKTPAAPVISSFSPDKGQHGDIITISGTNFSTVPAENSITFNGVAATIVSATSTELKVSVPKSMDCSGTLRVTVVGRTAESGASFTYVPTSIVNTLAGSTEGYADGAAATTMFDHPFGVAVDASGNVYVTDEYNYRIRKITSSGTVSTLAGSTEGYADGTGATAKFYYPTGIALDVSGNLYVADLNNDRIRKITSSGTVSTLAGSAEGYADGMGATAMFYDPWGVATDASGNVYVADINNHLIRKITPTGTVSTLAGSTAGYADGTGATAMFYYPAGVAVDASDNIYVADQGNNRIRKITPSGTVSTLAGSAWGYADGAGAAAKFNSPTSVAVDASGNIYVADHYNHRIRKITQE
ncbi:MAG: IPT/TIG domain-containing protein [Chitinophagaceae bacterium]|nr:IPT/TIG domain-containing protein [Chitinophagaceae bacterium]